jgi:hypothetical protein
MRPATPELSMRACGVDRVTPDIVGKFFRADHTGDERPAVYAEANLPPGFCRLAQHVCLHAERRQHTVERMAAD